MIRRLTINIGLLFYQVGLFDESLEFLFEGLDYSELSNSANGKLYSYSNLANCYLLMGKKDEAKKYYLKTLDLSKELDDVITLSSASSGLAKLAYEKGDIKKAYEYLENAKRILSRNDQKGWELNISLDLLEIYVEQSEVDKIKEMLPRLRQIASEIENDSFYMRLFNASSKYYSKIEEYEKAYEMSKKAFQYQKILMEKEEFSKVKEVKDNIIYQQYQQLEILSDIGKQITSYSNLNKIFKSVNESLRRIYDDFNFAIGIYNGKEVQYDYFNFKGQLLEPFTVEIENKNSFGNYAIKNDTPILIKNIYEEYDQYIEEFQLYGGGNLEAITPSLMLAPLKIQDKILGVIQIQSYKEGAFSVEDIKILEIIASYAAIAINNSLQAKKLKELATKDALTGLFNWRYYSETLKEKVYICQIDNCNLTLVVIDIDHFKKINDTYGHEAGNLCLIEVANRIRKIFDNEVICRIGGEEFAIMTHASNIDSIKEKSKRVVEEISNKPIVINDKEIYLTISLGQISYHNNVPNSVDEIFRQADAALYEAKENGRNQSVIEII